MIKPIETWYAGHRFRSRLEARWAVFFDHLGIHWRYELQGYWIGDSPSRPYLPDFWLPNPGVWVEVKGANSQLDIQLLVDAALCENGLPPGFDDGFYETRILILGPHQHCGHATWKSDGLRTWVQPVHATLDLREGHLFQGYAWFKGDGIHIEPGRGGNVAARFSDINWAGQGTEWGNWVNGGMMVHDGADTAISQVAAAYTAARSARFEHGETGAGRP